ncbi:MAG: hypothetical protein LBV68_08075 [Spirochaetaceae bacterium]|nr:hypothetical protein [Spirochaetaceae bacterium]
MDERERREHDFVVAKMLAKAPKNSKELFKEAYAHDKKHEYDEAIADYTLVLEITHDEKTKRLLAKCYCKRGDNFLWDGKYYLALGDYQNASSLRPNSNKYKNCINKVKKCIEDGV